MTDAPTAPPINRVLDLLRARGEVKKNGREWLCLCPAHDDTTPSLNVTEGNGGRVLLQCRSRKCPAGAIAAALKLNLRDLFADDASAGKSSFEQRIVRTYDYRDEAGKVLFQAVRMWAPAPKNKDFRQRRPDGKGGWIWKLDDVRKVVYRLPEMLAADITEVVFVAEGEKDVEALVRCGLIATTNPMGAGKWRREYAAWFKGRNVVILPDNDEPGRNHAEDVRKSLAGVAASVKVVSLPGLPDKADVSDWIDDQAAGAAERVDWHGIGAALWRLCITPDNPARNSAYGAPLILNGKDHPKPDPFDAGISLSDLLASDIAPPRFVIDGLLPEGLSILAGRPKFGKSWLAMLKGISVARGLTGLGKLAGGSRHVLYLALEDTRRRFRDRAAKLLAALGTTPPETLNVRTSWPRAGSGGLDRIREWLKQHPGGLVVIDTLARFRDPPKGRNSYDEDYTAVAELKALADQYEAAILIVHHTRKGAADDPFDEVSGTLGINGAADAIFVLDRQRGMNTAALYLTGRDLPDQTLSLGWNPDAALWSITGRTDGIERLEKIDVGVNKVQRCEQWLRGILELHSWPDAELLAGAVRNGFTHEDVKRAKTVLRKGEPPLRSKPRGAGGAWWNWIGSKSSPANPDRPETARNELLGSELLQTTETGEVPP